MNRRYCNGMVHVIKQGETLYQLSRRYRVPLAVLLRANPYVDVYNLQVGQEICIPVVRPNGMVCFPVAGMMPRENQPGNRMDMPDSQAVDMEDTGRNMEDAGRNMEDAGRNTEGSGRNMEDAGDMAPVRAEEMEKPSCESCGSEEITKNDWDGDDDRDDVEIYITSGGRSLGDILNEYGVNWEDFVKNNKLEQIVLGDDVVLYLPKKGK